MLKGGGAKNVSMVAKGGQFLSRYPKGTKGGQIFFGYPKGAQEKLTIGRHG